jgi:hypothetical protein
MFAPEVQGSPAIGYRGSRMMQTALDETPSGLSFDSGAVV